MIDLHSHTYESDGTFSPAELVEEARRMGVRVLAITDHDTFAGYEKAAPLAKDAGVELLCGIELSTRLNGAAAHLLGYFLDGGPSDGFRAWLADLQSSRRERNVRLIERLRELGIAIELADVEKLGRSVTGRPHFARVLVEKGHATSIQNAFALYLDESAPGYVRRREPSCAEAIAQVRAGGGIASLAHPVRLPRGFESSLPALCEAGLGAIEAHHSDHSPERIALYEDLARQHGLSITGGSDFHGTVKPGIQLGVGRGQLKVPSNVLGGRLSSLS